MLEIIVEPRRVANLRLALVVAVKNGEYDSLHDDIRDCFSDDQVDEIEEFLDTGDFAEAVDDIITDWNAEDVDELFEAICVFFAESNIEIQFLADEDYKDESEVDFDAFEDEGEPDTEDEFVGEGDIED